MDRFFFVNHFPGIICLILLWALLFSGTTIAAERDTAFTTWLDEFRREALAAGISQKTLKSALASVQYSSEVIRLDRNQPEFTLTLSEYLGRVVSPSRIRKGHEKLAAHRDLLKEIEDRYGVASHYLVALWGMESSYCRHTGNFPILEALTTLTFDPRRSTFFKKELLAALHLLDQGTLSLQEMRGSWAGALGCLQFLPTVFREYGVDFDQDRRMEIFQAGGDLFATAASYLSRAGWHSGESWGAEVIIEGSIGRKQLAGRVPHPVSYWLKQGVRYKSGWKKPENDPIASLIRPDPGEDRYFLIYENFDVLLTWNRSDYYAIGVGLLADQIKNGT